MSLSMGIARTLRTTVPDRLAVDEGGLLTARQRMGVCQLAERNPPGRPVQSRPWSLKLKASPDVMMT